MPGTGHLIVGYRRVGLAFLVPTIALAALVAAWAASVGSFGVLAAVVAPGALAVLAVANFGVALWRAAAGLDPVRRARPGTWVVVASCLIMGLTVGIPHVIAARSIAAADELLGSLFAPAATDPASTPVQAAVPPVSAGAPPPAPGASAPTTSFDGAALEPSLAPSLAPPPTPSPTPPTTPDAVTSARVDDLGAGTLPPVGAAVPWVPPGAAPWGDDGRFDLLLLGSDAGRDRSSRRTDVMLLVEVDVASGRVAMVGLPRNLTNAPYPPGPARDAVACACQPGLLNEMYVEASVRHPALWPGATPEIKGIGAVRAVVSEITGRPIDAVLVADLVGVIRVVDAMGGIDITVPAPVEDAMYPDPIRGDVHLRIAAGRQHMDGRTALAYARSRHQDSDYGRMDRQQTLLLAIRDAIGPGAILAAPALLAAARGMAWTDLPREALPGLIELFGRASHAPVAQLRIVPPTWSSALTRAEVDRIRAAIAALIPGGPAPAPATAPFPVPTPVPRPTTVPTPSVAPSPSGPPSPVPGGVAVGDYRCRALGPAKRAVAADGFDLRWIAPDPADGAFDDAWVVVRQDPPAGSVVLPGSDLELVVAPPGSVCP